MKYRMNGELEFCYQLCSSTPEPQVSTSGDKSNMAMLEVALKPQKHKGHVQSHCVPMQTKEEGKTMDLRGLGRDE